MRIVVAPLLIWVAALSGCVAPPSAQSSDRRPPPARPTVAPPAVAVAPVARAEGAVASGIWTYATDARGSRALFGQQDMDALLVIRCDRTARRIFLSVPGVEPGTLTLRATSTAKAVAARPTGSTPPYVAVELDPADPILDALAFSRGRFTIALDARQTVVPAWPEFTRVVEDCRA